MSTLLLSYQLLLMLWLLSEADTISLEKAGSSYERAIHSFIPGDKKETAKHNLPDLPDVTC